jgi:hypothetical protein
MDTDTQVWRERDRIRHDSIEDSLICPVDAIKMKASESDKISEVQLCGL